MDRQRRLVVVAATIGLVVCALVVAMVWTRARTARDPRAFPVDDGEVPFDEVLSRTGIVVPACLDERLRYAFVRDSQTFSYRKVYLEFSTQRSCLDEFLAGNHGQRSNRQAVTEHEREYAWPPLTAQLEVLVQLGWQLDPSLPVDTFDFVSKTAYSVEGVVQDEPDTDRQLVYVYGWVPP